MSILLTDATVVIQLLLLPHFLPPKGRIRLKQEHYKFSISECKNSILLHAKVIKLLILYVLNSFNDFSTNSSYFQ